MRKQRENGKRYPPEAKANSQLPDIDHAKTAVLNSLSSPESKRGYRHAIDEFIRWYCSEPRFVIQQACRDPGIDFISRLADWRREQWSPGCRPPASIRGS